MVDTLRPEITAMVLQNLGNPVLGTDNNYTVFGMPLSSATLSMQVEIAFDYVNDLIGDGALATATNARKIRGFATDYATLRLLGVLAGIAIPVHYNFTAGGLNIQIPVVSQMKEMIEMYRQSCIRWQKLLLSRHSVQKATDMELVLINEKFPTGSGITQVSYDSQTV